MDSISQLKSVTQNLKSITSPIAPQANLRNTGIMAGNQMTEKQREAAKARTSRISLSSAIGVAEVKDEATPMKTIKIQRPKLAPRSALSKPATVAKVDSAERKYLVVDLVNGGYEYLASEPEGGFNVDTYKTTKMVFRKIPAGKFVMGSPVSEVGRDDNEIQHEVTLTKPFYMGVFEVTQKQWKLITGKTPSML
jgi:formylglycine-generating enzyme required for sulfatase activity